MITSLEEAKIYFKIWQAATTDAARFNCLLKYKTRFTVHVDNDMVYVKLNCDEFISEFIEDPEITNSNFNPDSDFNSDIQKLNEDMNPFSNFGYVLLNEIFVSLGIDSDFV